MTPKTPDVMVYCCDMIQVQNKALQGYFRRKSMALLVLIYVSVPQMWLWCRYLSAMVKGDLSASISKHHHQHQQHQCQHQQLHPSLLQFSSALP